MRKNFMLAFTNNAVTVNGQAVSRAGRLITVLQLSQSATTVLAGQHTFANHGACVSFFARNKHLFILTVQH